MDIEKAARIEREKVHNDLRRAYEIHKDIQHYLIATSCIDKYAVDLFKSGVNYTLSLPLEERLNELEIKKIREIYQNCVKFHSTNIKQGLSAYDVCNCLKAIFGKEMFENKSNDEKV